jgi:RNA polymerase sigma-70 factor (ECF subfamily)
MFLLRLAQEDNEQAFVRLFDIHFVAVSRYAAVYVRNVADAEQLAMDVFIYVWEHRKTLQITTSVKSYLMTSVRNRCLNFLRDHGRERIVEQMPFDTLCHEYPVEYAELEQFISEAVESLPPKSKTVFKLSREENMSHAEISETTGISIKTIEGHITKALSLIRRYLNAKY